MPGTLFVVATPIGNLEDISARALRILGEVAVIAAEDTRRTGHLLTRYAIRTPTVSLHEHNEGDKATGLIARLMAGESVALVSDAGTPTVSDPGQHLVRLALDAGARVEAIPGPSAPNTLLSISGLPGDTFAFLGFPPIKSEDRKSWFQQLGSEPRTCLFFESPHRLLATLDAIRLYFGDCHIIVGRELTKLHEQVFRGRVSDAIAEFSRPVGEFVLAINLSNDQNRRGSVELTDDQIADAYAASLAHPSTSKRKAAQEVARKLGLSPNRVYQVIERRKGSVE